MEVCVEYGDSVVVGIVCCLWMLDVLFACSVFMVVVVCVVDDDGGIVLSLDIASTMAFVIWSCMLLLTVLKLCCSCLFWALISSKALLKWFILCSNRFTVILSLLNSPIGT